MAAKVKESNLTKKREIMAITTRDDATPMKEIQNGTEIQVEGYVIQEILVETTGETFDSIVVKDKAGNLYATRSETFIRKMQEIMTELKDEITEEEPLIIKITRQKSKNGREFISCALA